MRLLKINVLYLQSKKKFECVAQGHADTVSGLVELGNESLTFLIY